MSNVLKFLGKKPVVKTITIEVMDIGKGFLIFDLHVGNVPNDVESRKMTVIALKQCIKMIERNIRSMEK